MLNYDSDKIKNILLDFYNSTGININLLDNNFNSICYLGGLHNNYCKYIHSTNKGLKSCANSDATLLDHAKDSKVACSHICHAGLTDIAVPIIFDGLIIGYIILGQLKSDVDFDAIKDTLKALDLDTRKAEQLYCELTCVKQEKIESVSRIATMLAEHILTKNMLKPNINKNVEKAVSYINSHIDNELSIAVIAREMNISKSVLYRQFNTVLGCTPIKYITEKRIEAAKKLLTSTDNTIEEIAVKSGFSSVAYFCKLFKKQSGMTPTRYRNSN